MSAPSADPPDPFNTRRPEVHELDGWRRLVFAPAAFGLRVLYGSWRIRADAASRAVLEAIQPPRLIIVWHNRSLVTPEVFRRLLDPSRIACLISPSRVAAWEVAFFRLFRLRVIRGSTTRRSIQSAREMLRELRSGNDVGISPDGPSGPLYHFQPGAARLARKAGVPVLLVVANARAAWRPRTWDRHLVPLPFARIEVAVRAVPPDDPLWAAPGDAAIPALRRLCLELTEDPFQAPPP